MAALLTEPLENREADAFVDFFRCPEDLCRITASGSAGAAEGYFAFGKALCYGHPAGAQPQRLAERSAPQVQQFVEAVDDCVRLPFDLSEVVTNLREERYRQSSSHLLESITGAELARSIYYFLRPILPIPVRKHLRKLRLAGWQRIAFPRWLVDVTVETLMQTVMTLALKATGLERIPFIWFWPEGARGCVMMTHDVETAAGGDFCGELMDLDDSFGIRSAFQLVPEPLAGSSDRLWQSVRERGFEVNLHDLNHDGTLFSDRAEFLKRAAQINRYAHVLQCQGFRSGAMYRQQAWFDAFEFSYDMSVPNVAHLEPQRGGCCTVMPYFIGNVLELPLTTTQDYSLFHIIGEYSTRLWKEQTERILAKNGLASFIAHPDYLQTGRARKVYCELLEYLVELRSHRGAWTALPAEINRWWRNRDEMVLVPKGNSWQIVGPESGRARVAYAELGDDGRAVYKLDGQGGGL